MSKVFCWHWEVIGGPHAYLNLVFGKGNSASMHAKVLQLLPDRFKLDRQHENSQSWMTPDSREWDYLEVLLASDRLRIERGWGGGGDVDSRFLKQLLESGDVAIGRWRVESGGDGYAQHYIDTGLGLEDFVAYCAGETEEAPPEEVEEQLGALLQKHGWREKYSLGAVSNSGVKTIFPLLYDVPRIDDGQGYDARAFAPELDALARELCELCHVRIYASATWPPDPVTKEVVGGSLVVTFRQL